MSTTAASSEARTASEKKLPKKRVITEARREQNRAAQRAWRERQRHGKASTSQPAAKPVRHEALRVVKLSRPRLEISLMSRVDVKTLQDSGQEISTGSASNSDEISDINTSQNSLKDIASSRPSQFCVSPDSDEQPSHSNPDSLSVSYRQADPKINTLQNSQTQTLLAILNNARCLGFDIGKLMDCHESHVSPFYRPIAPTDNPHDVIATTLNLSIPIHLQPTMAQMLVPHHAALDLVPLPLLRDRIIMLSFAMPKVFDLWDLKQDIYVRDGIALKSKSDRGEWPSWDRKSWEMKPWFGEKWGMGVCE
ncbi:hypothetical protein N7493_006768 [Penicillium malachiteum]|uniref:BZIP domain-containing protein n=1 Tax=Penicillium malachiteum TaxID=1324776 RepID=A0AAD6MUV5_9EURO|nr:hypothetical protein N7493_006768 [Penicillium malachiteum]